MEAMNETDDEFADAVEETNSPSAKLIERLERENAQLREAAQRPTPETDAESYDDPTPGYEVVMADFARRLERERDSLRAANDTLKEQLKADKKAACELRRIIHEVADHCGISTRLWPAAIAERLKQMKDDKDEIENMWEKLTMSIGAQGPGSDPLTGCDKNYEIQKRAMERIRDMIAGEAQAREEFDDFKANARFRCSQLQEQRDKLAEACKKLMDVVGPPNATIEQCWAGVDEIDEAWEAGKSALAAVKGGDK